jgi:hypothetical protein
MVARVDIPIVVQGRNQEALAVAPTTIDATMVTDGGVIKYVDVNPQTLLVDIVNTGTIAMGITFAGGDFTVGGVDQAYSINASSRELIFMNTVVSKCKNNDGTVNVNFDSEGSQTGSILVTGSTAAIDAV